MYCEIIVCNDMPYENNLKPQIELFHEIFEIFLF